MTNANTFKSESVFLQINFKGRKPLIIGSIYRPTNNCRETCAAICDDLIEVFGKNPRAVFWIGGDFNLPDIDWAEQKIIGKQYPAQINEKFLETFQDLGLSQIISKPTRGNAILDLLFTNTPGLFKNEDIIPGLGCGDHDMVFIETSLKPPNSKPPKRRIQLWKAADISAIKKDALEFSHQFLKTFNEKVNVNTLWNFIKQKLMKIMDTHVPTKFSSLKTTSLGSLHTLKGCYGGSTVFFRKLKVINQDD